MISNVSAQNNQMLVQLVDYDVNTQQSKIHIQNTAGFELTEVDFYINNIRTGRIANNLADGKAIVYYQTVTPGTYDITIKTKEIEFTKEIKFADLKQTIPQVETTGLKTASQLADDEEYQELLREKEIEITVVKQVGFFEKITEKITNKVKGIAPRPTRANAQTYGLFLPGISFVAGGIISLLGYWLFIRLRRTNRGRNGS